MNKKAEEFKDTGQDAQDWMISEGFNIDDSVTLVSVTNGVKTNYELPVTLVLDAYAKHYAKRLAKKVYKKLSEFDEGESHYKNQDVEEQYNHEAYGYSCGIYDFKRKLIKRIKG